MTIRTLDEIGPLKSKRVLTRVDLNVPVKSGVVTDTKRLVAAKPSVEFLAQGGAKVILLAHFGRPKGTVREEMSLRMVVPALSDVLGRDVAFATLDEAAEAIDRLPDGGVLLLENVRFFPGEEANDPAFADRLAALGDIYVNDAFSAAHRAHASTEALAHRLPAYAGRTMQAELDALEKALGSPDRPVIAVVGGAKVSSKIDLLEHLVTKVDALAVAGGMANTFLHALGVKVGKSLHEPDEVETVRRIMTKAEETGCAIILPKDALVATALEDGVPTTIVGLDQGVPDDQMILDLGPISIDTINGELDRASTLVWNGPLGAFEVEPFDAGTVACACHAAERTAAKGLLSVAGGGDTAAALAHAEVLPHFSYVSTAGGAFLEWLEGKALPGVEALRQPA